MINGKILKKSLSLVLTVLMLASLCAVCFGSFATAFGINDEPQGSLLFLDFENEKGVADYNGVFSGFTTDPADPSNKVFKVVTGIAGGSTNWMPGNSAETEVDQDAASDAFKLMNGATYVISFKLKVGAGANDVNVNHYYAQNSDKSGKTMVKSFYKLTIDETNATLEEDVNGKADAQYCLNEDTDWIDVKYSFTTPTAWSTTSDGLANDSLVFVCHNANINHENTYYFDDFTIDAVDEAIVYEFDGEKGTTGTYWTPNNNGAFANSDVAGGSYVDAAGYHLRPTTSTSNGYNTMLTVHSTPQWMKAMQLVDSDVNNGTPFKMMANHKYIVTMKFKINSIDAGNAIRLGIGYVANKDKGQTIVAPVGEYRTTTDWIYFETVIDGSTVPVGDYLTNPYDDNGLQLFMANKNATAGACETIVESIRIVDKLDNGKVAFVSVTDTRGENIPGAFVDKGTLYTLPTVSDADFLYWKDQHGNMYGNGQKVGIAGDSQFTAVYKQVINFIDDATGTKGIPLVHNSFSNSNTGGSYILDEDKDGVYDGGVFFYGSVGQGEIGAAKWMHKVFLYDPDLEIGDAGKYLQIKKNTVYTVTVTYKPATLESRLGIGVSADVGVTEGDSSMCTNYVATDKATQADIDGGWKTLTCTIDGNGQAMYGDNNIIGELRDVAGRYIVLTSAWTASSGANNKHYIKDVVVTTIEKSDEDVFVVENIEGVETVKGMTPGDVLLPAGKNSLGEASIGWIDEDGAAIKTVPSKDATIYAIYPSTVLNFESGKGVADYNCAGAPSGIVTDPDDANNMVVKIVSGTWDGSYNWIPAKTGGVGASIDTATTAYELKPNTKYRVSLKYKIEKGSANWGICFWRGNRSDYDANAPKDPIQEFRFTANENNGTLIEGTTDQYALDKRTKWLDLNYEFTTPATLGTNTHLCLVNVQHGVEGYAVNNIYYFDNVVIEEVSAANEIYKTPVVDAKSSLRKKSETQSAGLRFRGELKGDLVAGADEVGFVTIPVQLLDQAGDDWYKITADDITADKGKFGMAAYVKINDHTSPASYYYYDVETENYQYQLCITGMNEKSKAAQFMTVMYIKTDDKFEYKFVNIMSYNNVKQVYEAKGILGY